MSLRHFLMLTLFWNAQHLFCQPSLPDAHLDLIASLMDIASDPEQLKITNSIPIDTLGGHLQGIQHISQNAQEYVMMSGSSGQDSYLALAEIGAAPKVIKIQKLLEKPFKHAGGFQVHQNFLAVGIEDNDARNHSFVMIFDVHDITAIPNEPFIKIERKGVFERSTAGCVGLVKFGGYWIMVVGDWNTEHLDFYLDRDDRLDNLELVSSKTTKELDRTNWVNLHWRPYQNLNFITSQDQLYLAGMTSNAQGNNLVDLYAVTDIESSAFNLQKIATKSVDNTGGDFIWSAGLQVKDGLIRQIISCDRNLSAGFKIYQYNR